MITAKDIRNKRFEKAAFGYKQEEIDEFLAQLESELNEMEEERTDVNNKIQIHFCCIGWVIFTKPFLRMRIFYQKN